MLFVNFEEENLCLSALTKLTIKHDNYHLNFPLIKSMALKPTWRWWKQSVRKLVVEEEGEALHMFLYFKNQPLQLFR